MTTVPPDGGVRKGFTPVSKSHPCPVCLKPDWCLLAADGAAAICQRVDAGSVKRCGDAGWLHRLADPATPPPAQKSKKAAAPRDWPRETMTLAKNLTAEDAAWIHDRLGLPAGALDAVPLLGTSGRNAVGVVTTWPECDATGTVIGIVRRIPGEPKDDKKTMAGGKRGLTLPAGWRGEVGPVFVVEGPTDAAAVATAGLSAIGRPSKDGGGKLLATLFASWPAERAIVIVGENDPPADDGSLPGRDAATRLASRLSSALKRPVLTTLPPAGWKDVRCWLTDPDRGDTLWPERGAELAALLMSAAGEAEPPAGEAGPPTARGGRPTIVLGTDEYRVNEQVTAALASENDIYQRGGMLVHVLEQDERDEALDNIRRPPGTPVVRELAKPLLRERSTRAAEFYKVRVTAESEEYVPAHPPGWAVEAVHARGYWPGVRYLEAVVTHPIFLADGSILAASGYHAGTRILAAMPTGMAINVPDRPTKSDVVTAIETLIDPLADFPFQTPEHRAAMVAGLLTPLAWFAFNGTAPLFLIDKNVRGAGAGLLADVIALTLTGRRFSTMAYTPDRDELRKRITSLAVEGDRMVLLDNLAGAVGNDVLDNALTTDRWKDRLLGGNRLYDGPLHVTWYGTGNNVMLAADTSRRVCHIRMESADERPELREGFKYPDLREHVRTNRGPLMSAALTVLRGWHVAGRPTHGLKAWGSFEAWSHVVREAVVFAGLPDPGDTREALQSAADQDAGAMMAIINGLEQMDPGRRGLTAAEIVNRLQSIFDIPDWQGEMRSAVEDLCRKLDARALGLKFRHFKRRNFGGKMIDAAGEDRISGNRWAVFPASRSPSRQYVEPDAGDAGDAGHHPDPAETEIAPVATRFRANSTRGVPGLDSGGGVA